MSTALVSGKCPKTMAIYSSHNKIYNKGAETLAEALYADKLPEKLKLHLGYNNIQDKGKGAILKALQHELKHQTLPLGLKITGVPSGIDELLSEAS